MPQMLWTNLFVKEQGYSVGGAITCQDNKSMTLFESNGNFMRIKHFPTKEMIADFFTKPLQGKLFITLCNKIVGIQ